MLLKKNFLLLVGPLTKLFRAYLAISYVPINWRTSRVAFITKCGKVGHSVAKNYRLITLVSVLLKTLEKVVNSKMDEDLTAFSLVISQHAYQRGKSSETALQGVVSYFEAGVIMATLIDVGAFNNTLYDASDSSARDNEINGIIRMWLEEYLKHRHIVLKHGFSKLSVKVK